MERNNSNDNKETERNQDQQAVDKAPGEERGQGDQVTTNDLKGKKVDADPDKKEDRPSRQ